MKKNIKEVRSFSWKSFLRLYLFDLVGAGIFLAIIFFAAAFFLRSNSNVQVVLRVSHSDYLELWHTAPKWLTEYLQPGMQEKDALGRKVIEVKDVEYYPTNGDSQVTYVTLNVRAVYNKRMNQYSYNGNPILVGSYQELRLQGVRLTGVVHAVGDQHLVSEKRVFRVRGYIDPRMHSDWESAESLSDGVKNYIADKVQDDAEIKDSHGNVFVRIEEVIKRTATRTVVRPAGITRYPDTQSQRVELTVDIVAEKIGEKFFFKKEQPLIVGYSINFDFPMINFPLVITDLEALDSSSIE